MSPCYNNPCENNGTCSVNADGNAQCSCGQYSGQYCTGMAIALILREQPFNLKGGGVMVFF